MRFSTRAASRRGREAGFTLAEVLAALFFMALVIPVAVEALHIASQAGSSAQRKSEAARIAQTVMNENVLSGNWSQNMQGVVRRNGHEYQWRMHNETWQLDAMQLVTAEVNYSLGDRNGSLRLSTLVNPTNATVSTVSIPWDNSLRVSALTNPPQP